MPSVILARLYDGSGWGIWEEFGASSDALTQADLDAHNAASNAHLALRSVISTEIQTKVNEAALSASHALQTHNSATDSHPELRGAILAHEIDRSAHSNLVNPITGRLDWLEAHIGSSTGGRLLPYLSAVYTTDSVDFYEQVDNTWRDDFRGPTVAVGYPTD